MSLEDRIALFEGHIKKFGEEIPQKFTIGRKKKDKYNKNPDWRKYADGVKRAEEYLKPKIPTPLIVEPQPAWQKYIDAPSVRPEPNDKWMKPFAASARGYVQMNPQEPAKNYSYEVPNSPLKKAQNQQKKKEIKKLMTKDLQTPEQRQPVLKRPKTSTMKKVRPAAAAARAFLQNTPQATKVTYDITSLKTKSFGLSS